MTMMDFITTSLQKRMINKSLEGYRVYLFGSSLYSSKVNDIDLLIEYDEDLIDIDSALSFRIEIEEILAKIIETEIDICLLSKSEHLQTQFIKTEKGKILPLTMAKKS